MGAPKGNKNAAGPYKPFTKGKRKVRSLGMQGKQTKRGFKESKSQKKFYQKQQIAWFKKNFP